VVRPLQDVVRIRPVKDIALMVLHYHRITIFTGIPTAFTRRFVSQGPARRFTVSVQDVWPVLPCRRVQLLIAVFIRPGVRSLLHLIVFQRRVARQVHVLSLVESQVVLLREALATFLASEGLLLAAAVGVALAVLEQAVPLGEAAPAVRADVSLLERGGHVGGSLLQGRCQAADVRQETVVPKMQPQMKSQSLYAGKRFPTFLANFILCNLHRDSRVRRIGLGPFTKSHLG